MDLNKLEKDLSLNQKTSIMVIVNECYNIIGRDIDDIDTALEIGRKFFKKDEDYYNFYNININILKKLKINIDIFFKEIHRSFTCNVKDIIKMIKEFKKVEDDLINNNFYFKEIDFIYLLDLFSWKFHEIISIMLKITRTIKEANS